MKKRLFTLLVAIAAMMLCQAEVVTPDQALAVAHDFINQGSHNLKAGVPLKLAYQAHSINGTPDYYVFNNGGDGGFIVVSGDDCTVPVWGYSTSGSFDYESLPENAKWWFSEYQRQLQYLRDNPQVKARKPVKLTTSVGPLLTTKWDQCQPYNMFCPSVKDNNNKYWEKYWRRAATGCFATALAQIMNYHKWPNIGSGNITYECILKEFLEEGSNTKKNTTIILSGAFNQSSYQWASMMNDYKTEVKNNNITNYYKDDNGNWVQGNEPCFAVAKLMKDVGLAIKTQYGASGRGGSSADIYDIATNVPLFFDYRVIAYSRDAFQREHGTSDWDPELQLQLSRGYPFFYFGKEDSEETGHGFVLDGFDDNGRFHVNWGWGGRYDGYYYSSLLEYEDDYSVWHDYSDNNIFVLMVPERDIQKLSSQLKGKSFGVVKTNSRSSESLHVIGQNLSQDVSISLSGANASMFSTVETVSAAEANAEGGKTVKVIYHPTETGDHTAQITVSAGDGIEPITFTITGKSCVNNDANGDEEVDISDVVAAIQAILNGGSLPFDETPDVSIIVAIINAILNGDTNLDVDDGLVAYYPFDGDAHDASGHGNDGEVNNLWLTHGVNGDTNGAWHFGGYHHSGCIRIPNSESLQFTDGFTFACYVKPLDWSGMDGWGYYSNRGYHCIFAKDHDRTGPTLGIGLNDNMEMFAGNGSFVDSWCCLGSGDKINGNRLNEWVHIAVTYSKTKARMYIDGILVDEKNINADFSRMNSHDLYLGKFSDYWYPLNGVLDEVRIYNRALTWEEVKALASDNAETQSQNNPFKLSKKAVTLAVGESVTIYLINGSGSYSLGSNVNIVDYSLDNAAECFTLTGTNVGSTNVTVIDVDTQTTVYLPVTVTNP